ncbi:MAG: GTPase Era [Gemmatimonadota bacterium]
MLEETASPTPPSPSADAPSFRSGFAGLVGLPNVGKSTLLNRLVGERLSIVTAKAQTTRRRLLGIYTDDSHQAVFVDTPGLLDPRYRLQEAMRAEATAALQDADVLVDVVDAGFEPSVEWACTYDPGTAAPRILCLNKVDRVGEGRRDELLASFEGGPWVAVMPTVAEEGRGVEALRAAILGQLPESPPFYPRDELSDAPVREFVAELVRETCLEELAEEVPYSIAVRVEEFRDRGPERAVYIEALLYVERESQKGIVIGAGGRTIRKIGTAARGKIEAFLGRHVYLELRVKVLPNWRKRDKYLTLLGFRVPSQES